MSTKIKSNGVIWEPYVIVIGGNGTVKYSSLNDKKKKK